MAGTSPAMTLKRGNHDILFTLVISLPEARMRDIASATGSVATAMWNPLACTSVF
jgi:hypothetical protein